MSEVVRSLEAQPLRRFKPHPAYKDSGVEWLWGISVHWKVKRLKRVFRVVNGSTPASGESSFWDGDIPISAAVTGKIGVRLPAASRDAAQAGGQGAA